LKGKEMRKLSWISHLRVRCRSAQSELGSRVRNISFGAGTALVISICAAMLPVPLAANAEAASNATEVSFCGTPINNVDPGAGISALEQLTSQGNEQIVSAIAQAISLGKSTCPLIEFLTETGAEVVVDGALLEVVDVRLPNGVDELVAATHTAIENAEAQTPPTLPDVGPSSSLVWAPVSWATLGINIRPEPDTNVPPVGTVPDGTYVAIQCTASGPTITSAGGPTNVWDLVTYHGVTGYVADAYINTGRLTAVAPAC
jgi:uncharacterized protein YraI